MDPLRKVLLSESGWAYLLAATVPRQYLPVLRATAVSFGLLSTLYILHLTQQTCTINSRVYDFDSFPSSAGILMRHTSTPESVCSSRHVVKLTLKLTKEITVFAKKKFSLRLYC